MMNICTDKEYILAVNTTELKELFENAGCDNVVLFPEEDLTREELTYLKETDKVIMFVYYCPGDNPDENPELVRKCQQIKESDIRFKIRHVMDVEDEGYSWAMKELQNSADDMSEIIQQIESNLIHYGFIHETDYTNRCGNCHIRISDYKYCPYCGTKRGEGAFLPYLNPSYAAYGPSTVQKVRCLKCNYLWNASVDMDKDSFMYCPQCGTDMLKIQKTRYVNFWEHVGLEEPYDEDERPVLFTKDEVDRLLNYRDGESHYWGDDLFDRMRKAGITVPLEPEENYPKTEMAGEMLVLAEKLLLTKGKRYVRKCNCSYCGSDRVAAIRYDGQVNCRGRYIRLADEELFSERVRCGNIYYDSERLLSINEDGTTDDPAYLCLCCNTEFGQFELNKETKKKLEFWFM